MLKKSKVFILITSVIASIGVIFGIASMASEFWVNSEIIPSAKGVSDKRSPVNYGLFSGTFVRNILETPQVSTISIWCEYSLNICEWSTKKLSKEKEKELKQILNGDMCIKSQLKHSEPVNAKNFPVDNFFTEHENQNKTKCDLRFLNAGLRLSTIIFLSLSITFGILSAFFAIMNTAGNPINPWFNIMGLYVWNIIAAAWCLLTVILWISQFQISIKDNIALINTITGEYKNSDVVTLGYSFWFVIISMFLCIGNIGILIIRQYILNREPIAPTIKQDTDRDGMIFVY